MRIYLIRHAHTKTRANLDRAIVYANEKDKGLTKEGKEEAKK